MIRRHKNIAEPSLKKSDFSKKFKFMFRHLAFPLICCVLILGGFVWWQKITLPVDPTATTAQIFVIPKGQGIDTIGQRLAQDKLIRSAMAFKIYVLTHRLSRKIQAGDFRLRPSMNLATLTQELTQGTMDIWVTLLEGWRREEIAAKISQEFAARNTPFDIQKFLDITASDEGYLFPDTYLISRDSSPSAVASLLRSTFNKKVEFSPNSSGLNSQQVVVLASIVEREVNTEADRPIVAGILLNRLQQNWPLQADATVQYLVGTRRCQKKDGECDWWPKNLTKADLNLSSAYNTYEHPGLPPAPIANPSLLAIKAVLEPKMTDYWFYISDLKGQIHYARTIAEHNANIAKYLEK